MQDESAPLVATLFGPPRLTWRGGVVEAASRKGQALLYVLAVDHGGLRRAELAELLWSMGRVQNVRQELTTLRGLPGAQEWLEPEDPVRISVSSDVAAFEEACAAERFVDAIRLYRAPLLAGFEVARAPAFDDWLEVERQRLQDMLRHALRRRADELEREADYGAALELLDRLVALDPLDETSYRAAMRLCSKRGDPAAGLDYYAACRRALQVELGTEPLPETNELYGRLVTERDHSEARREQEARAAERSVTELSGMPLRLAQALALSGAPLPVEVLAEVIEAAPREVATTFDRLRELGLLSGHELVRSARRGIREATPGQLSRYGHGRAARALAAREADAFEVAAHFLAAHEPGEASGWFKRAADEAAAHLDWERATAALFRALWAAPTAEGRIRLLLNLEMVATQSAAAELREAALAALEEEAFLLQDDELLIEAQLRRSGQLIQTGGAKAAGEKAARAAASARRIGRHDLVARAEHAVGVSAFHTGALDRALAAFEQVVEYGDPEVQLPALNNLGVLAGIRGDVQGALKHHEHALTVARKVGKRQVTAGVLNNLGATSERAAEYEKAAGSFAEGARLFRALDNPEGEATAWINVADVRLKQGRQPEAAEALRRAAALEARLTAPSLTCRLLLLQGALAQSRGEYAAARKKLERALALAGEIDDERHAAVIRFNLEMTRRLEDPALDAVAAGSALARLEELRLNDVLPWAYAEMGAAAAATGEIRAWGEKLAQFETNPYVRLLALRLEARARALEGDESEPPGLTELEERFRADGSLAGG